MSVVFLLRNPNSVATLYLVCRVCGGVVTRGSVTSSTSVAPAGPLVPGLNVKFKILHSLYTGQLRPASMAVASWQPAGCLQPRVIGSVYKQVCLMIVISSTEISRVYMQPGARAHPASLPGAGTQCKQLPSPPPATALTSWPEWVPTRKMGPVEGHL